MPNSTTNSENILVDVPQEITYWFIRTDKGAYYDIFKNNDFIGINWNDITKHDLDNLSSEAIRAKIIRIQGFDTNDNKTKGKVTSILTKIVNFKTLKKNDVIIIPNKGTRELSFGIITDENIYETSPNANDCPFVKRRKVKWLASKELNRLNPKFLKLKINQHSISKINDLKNDINNIIFKIYKSGNYSHIVFDVRRADDIDTMTLASAMTNIQKLLTNINTDFNLNENQVDNSKIKLNIQSPGFFEIKAIASKTLPVFALFLIIASCSENSPQYLQAQDKLNHKGITNTQINNFKTENRSLLNDTINHLDIMEVKYQNYINDSNGFE